MDQAETSGKTVEDALNKALAKLGASRAEVELIILDEGRKGFLGRGARDAVVRVERLKGPQQPSPGRGDIDTRIPHASQRGGRSGREGRGGSPQGPQPTGQSSDRGGRGGDRGTRPAGRDQRGPRGGGSFEAATPKLTEQDFVRPPRYDEETATGEPPGRPRPERSAGGRGRQPQASAGAPRDEGPRDHDRRDEEPRRRREEFPEVTPDINAEEVDYAAHIVDDLLRILDINVELTIREPLTAGDGLGGVLAVIDISGEDLGLLIGRRGDTLLSLQYIVNLIVSRRYPGKGGVTLDVEHYRHRREELIISLAKRMAERVRETGNPITLEPMVPFERRLVHMAFADDPELTTNSIGEGDNRKVVISARR